MITIKELTSLLDDGRALVLYKDENGNYVAIDAADIAAAELKETKKELESKDRYIAKLEGVIKDAEEMLEAIVEEGHEDAERTLRGYLRERSDYKRGKVARGLYTYITSVIR